MKKRSMTSVKFQAREGSAEHKIKTMNPLVSLESATDNQSLEDRARERDQIIRDIDEIKRDNTMRPSHKVRKIDELMETLKHCNSEVHYRAHEILQNFI